MTQAARRPRTAKWFRGDGIPAFQQRAAMRMQGFEASDFLDKPIIGICNNWNEYTRCHLHFRNTADKIKQGIAAAGGMALEFQSMTMGADISLPNGISFMHRNLLAMEIEQTIRSYPMDGLVLLGACDETIPAMMMAAITTDIPAIVLPGGPGFNGYWRGESVGSSTDCHRLNAEFRAGRLSAEEWGQLETCIERSPGHCTTMGTASTMSCIAEALGMAPAGSAALPAGDARRTAMAVEVGRRAVELVNDDIRPSKILSRASFENAVRMLGAVAGSSNGVIHLLALARRAGIDLTLREIDRLCSDTPVVANLKPNGRHLMEDLFYAGGAPTVMKAIAGLLDENALTVTGRTVAENLAQAPEPDGDVILTAENALSGGGGISVLYGNIAPNGAVLKKTAASPELLVHSGRAVVFENNDQLLGRIEDPDLDIKPDDIMVLKGGGPVGAPGMPEWGSMPIPSKLLRAGVRDMVRISDSRMSGTAFGTIVLHVAPEAAVGGPIAAVRTGDIIDLDAHQRVVNVRITERELAQRMEQLRPRETTGDVGFPRMYAQHVLQADLGCDFDVYGGAAVAEERAVPTGGSGTPTPSTELTTEGVRK